LLEISRDGHNTLIHALSNVLNCFTSLITPYDLGSLYTFGTEAFISTPPLYCGHRSPKQFRYLTNIEAYFQSILNLRKEEVLIAPLATLESHTLILEGLTHTVRRNPELVSNLRSAETLMVQSESVSVLTGV
jgi:hypothetical protein